MSAQQGEGKRITQNEFTDKAWQSIIAAPDIAKQVCGRILIVVVLILPSCKAACPCCNSWRVPA